MHSRMLTISSRERICRRSWLASPVLLEESSSGSTTRNR
jgi:hypothetical protein